MALLQLVSVRVSVSVSIEPTIVPLVSLIGCFLDRNPRPGGGTAALRRYGELALLLLRSSGRVFSTADNSRRYSISQTAESCDLDYEILYNHYKLQWREVPRADH